MPPQKDYTGMKFGKLTAIRRVENTRWEFQCTCGERVIRSIQNVQSCKNKGNISSCKKCRRYTKPPKTEPRRLLIKGQKFGKLTAISPTGEVNKRRYAIWIFRCDCGKEVKRIASHIIEMANRGLEPNCGKQSCSGHNKMPGIEAGLRDRYRIYRRNAAIRGLEWRLTIDEVRDLMAGNCYYCGTPPSMISQARSGGHWHFVYNGIDRLNSNQGYLPGNVVTCCKNCNMAKRDMPYEEFIAWINLLIAYQKPK
jgi:predicted SprT family Zn-dependent metalloprotease